ncbi:MAG: outer membrane beta-barrel protein [Sphingobacteriales bacterium]|nr:MAG: outer membrane beta-barrel protein [Sphingobacteriales bacterium]
MADIGFGPRAEAANNTLYANSIIAIKQLYMSYAPADWVKFTLGNFSTFFGYELIEPQNNFHYSTSLAFQNGPFYHTGLKANFTKGKFNFLTGFFNDTDTKSDNDRNKYAGAQVGYTGDKVSGYLNWVGGNETNAHDTLSPFKNYKSSLGFTGLATLGKESKGSMALDFAWHRFRQKLAKGDDASSVQYFTTYLYGKYNLKDNVGLGLRLGYANNNDYAMPYVAGAAKNFVDVTLTSSITISDFLIVKPEFRLDYADEKVFLDRKGNGSNLQYRLLMATIFTF